MGFSADVLDLNLDEMIETVVASLRSTVRGRLRRRGAVVAVSGGIDSAACLALCARAFGAADVHALLLPERTSSPDSLTLGREVAERFGVEVTVADVTAALEAVGCYEAQDDAIRSVHPDYKSDWKYKLVVPSILEGDRLNVTRLLVERSDGERVSTRLPAAAYLQLVAATNFKQRIRTTMTYFHADRLNAAVCGTPNRLEYDQGFFVKGGDGLADVKPIAHLYKTQVYAIAEHLGVPASICGRTPTTDTFSLAQTQEEFYFALPYREMDLCLAGRNLGAPADEVAAIVGLTVEQVQRVYQDIDVKRRATAPLHVTGVLVADVPEVG